MIIGLRMLDNQLRGVIKSKMFESLLFDMDCPLTTDEQKWLINLMSVWALVWYRKLLRPDGIMNYL